MFDQLLRAIGRTKSIFIFIFTVGENATKRRITVQRKCCNTQRNLIQHVNMSTYILRLDTLVLIRWTGFFVPHGGMKMEPRQLRSEGSWTTLRFTLHPDTRSSKWKRVTMHYTFFFSLKCSAALIDTSLKALCLIRFSNSLSHTCTHSSVKDMIWYNPPVEKKNGQKHVLHQIIL